MVQGTVCGCSPPTSGPAWQSPQSGASRIPAASPVRTAAPPPSPDARPLVADAEHDDGGALDRAARLRSEPQAGRGAQPEELLAALVALPPAALPRVAGE
jgi:hypothetical protein